MLKKIQGVLWLFVVLAALFLGAWIVVDNDRLVDFVLWGFVMPRQSIGLLVSAAFTAGILIGLLGNVAVTSRMAIKLRRLEKRLQKKEAARTLNSGKSP